MVDAPAGETVEIGAGRVAVCSGVPELVVAVYVLRPENHTACAVEDEEGVVWVALVLDQSLDDEAVVVAVAVGRDKVGELKEAVAESYPKLRNRTLWSWSRKEF